MIDIVQLEPFPQGNPFLHDNYHMGVTIGTNVVVMMANHQDKECPYLIVCNLESGERIRLEFKDSAHALAIAKTVNAIRERDR